MLALLSLIISMREAMQFIPSASRIIGQETFFIISSTTFFVSSLTERPQPRATAVAFFHDVRISFMFDEEISPAEFSFSGRYILS